MNKPSMKTGVSLIVLAITIVVMIILATVIILAVRSDGIIGKAEYARGETDILNAIEIVKVAEAQWILDEEEVMEKEGVSNFKQYAEKKLREAGGKITTNIKEKEGTFEVTEGADVYAYPKIPEGFVASDLSSEDQVSEGLVIYEGTEKVSKDSDAATTRNQFVWVPVNSIGDFIQKEGYNINGTPQTAVASGNTTEPFNKASTSGVILSETNDLTGEYAEYKAMKSSVEKYGGFYIARYEAGNASNKVISKQGVIPWTDIVWGTSMTEIGIEGAVAKSRAMYEENDSFVSHLIYGVEWDAALYYIAKTYPMYIKDSDGKGYGESTALTTTGKDKNYSVNNIYDMAGNAYEWTMEAVGNDYRFCRGGLLDVLQIYPASYRKANKPYQGESDVSFRIAIYLK